VQLITPPVHKSNYKSNLSLNAWCNGQRPMQIHRLMNRWSTRSPNFHTSATSCFSKWKAQHMWFSHNETCGDTEVEEQKVCTCYHSNTGYNPQFSHGKLLHRCCGFVFSSIVTPLNTLFIFDENIPGFFSI